MGKADINFCEFDSHTAYHVDADIVEYTKKGPTPMYDLILGTRTLDKLGIILNFKDKTITMDDVILPIYTSLKLSRHQMAKERIRINTL